MVFLRGVDANTLPWAPGLGSQAAAAENLPGWKLSCGKDQLPVFRDHLTRSRAVAV